MADKLIFITGGTSGIGKQLAHDYLREGAKVVVTGRSMEKVDDLRGEFPDTFFPMRMDVTDRVGMVSLFDEVEKEIGPLDLVIANAGRSVGAKSDRPDFDAANAVIAANVSGVLNTFEGALKYMIPRRGGHIVAISSVAGFVGLPGAGSYSASKAAVTKLCESYSLDLRKDGIKVTNICPGFIDTPLTKKNNHSMPFIMGPEAGSKLIRQAIGKGKKLYLFPWQMRWVMTILDKMPRWLYRFLMSSVDYRKSK